MTTKELIEKYLNDNYTMQLATSVENHPRIFSVYFIVDDELNLYWASLPSRRHSQEIKINEKVAGAIVVQNQIGQPVIGVQVEGTAKEVAGQDKIKQIAQKYAARFNRTADWVEDFSRGKTEHKLYRLTPHTFVLFDEVNFKSQPRQELKLK